MPTSPLAPAPAHQARPDRLIRRWIGRRFDIASSRWIGGSASDPARARYVRVAWVAWLAGVLLSTAAQAQPSSCSSDGVPVPALLRERFLSAGCADCWREAAPPGAEPGVLALDWVLPGTQGDEAPLSAVARPEAAQRLEQLGLGLSASAVHRDAPVQAASRRSLSRKTAPRLLRVVQGQALGGYLGVEIRYATPRRAVTPLTAWLAMVEVLPQGTEGSPWRGIWSETFIPQRGTVRCCYQKRRKLRCVTCAP